MTFRGDREESCGLKLRAGGFGEDELSVLEAHSASSKIMLVVSLNLKARSGMMIDRPALQVTAYDLIQAKGVIRML